MPTSPIRSKGFMFSCSSPPLRESAASVPSLGAPEGALGMFLRSFFSEARRRRAATALLVEALECEDGAPADSGGEASWGGQDIGGGL